MPYPYRRQAPFNQEGCLIVVCGTVLVLLVLLVIGALSDVPTKLWEWVTH